MCKNQKNSPQNSVELLHEDGRQWKQLPDMKMRRWNHVQLGRTACGGIPELPNSPKSNHDEESKQQDERNYQDLRFTDI